MQELDTNSVAQALPGGIYYGDDRTILVCGANCPGKNDIVNALLTEGVSARFSGCHGSIGGCAMNGVLVSGAYATVPMQTEMDTVAIEVIIRK